MRTTFVILHYLIAKETQICIESILISTSNDDSYIVVVDNFSNNGSMEQIMNAYMDNAKVHFIKLENNLGFAKGNNAGYNYAKFNLKSDFIVLINNDTEINQTMFLKKLYAKFQEAPFDVLGPDIETLNHKHQNPVATTGYDRSKVMAKIRRANRNLIINKLGLNEILLLLNNCMIPKYIMYNKKNHMENILYKEEIENPVLHGSCMIFSPNYVRKFNGLYSGTFLYGEEEILWLIAKKEKLRLLYWPELKVFHKEDQSTNAQFISNRKRRIFKLRHELDSLKLLLRMMDEPEIYIQDIKS